MSARILNELGFVYAFHHVGGLRNSGFHYQEGGPQVGHVEVIGARTWAQQPLTRPGMTDPALLHRMSGPGNVAISQAGLLTWDTLPGAVSYYVYAFERGRQFTTPLPPAGRVPIGVGNAEVVTLHSPVGYVTIHTFAITNHTDLMKEMASGWVNVTTNRLDVTTMGLSPGVYEFRVQAIAPPIPANHIPILDNNALNLPFADSFVSGAVFGGIGNQNNHAWGTIFQEFEITAGR